jgi:hypothetical protein
MGKHSRSLWGPGEGRGACRDERKREGERTGQGAERRFHSRRYPTTCPTSMMKELLIASGASWVLEPGDEFRC